MKRSLRYYFIRLKRIIVSKYNTPESIARGVAIGVLVGMTPSVGFQIFPTILLAFLFRANKIVAVLFTYISNPFTIIPIYSLDFYLGRLFLSGFENARFSNIEDAIVNFSFKKLGLVGFDSLVVLWVGGLVIGIPSGIISYFLFYRIVLFYRKKKNFRLSLKKKEKSSEQKEDFSNPVPPLILSKEKFQNKKVLEPFLKINEKKKH